MSSSWFKGKNNTTSKILLAILCTVFLVSVIKFSMFLANNIFIETFGLLVNALETGLPNLLRHSILGNQISPIPCTFTDTNYMYWVFLHLIWPTWDYFEKECLDVSQVLRLNLWNSIFCKFFGSRNTKLKVSSDCN